MTISTTGRNGVALAAVCLSSLMFGLEISSVPSILPTLQEVLPAEFRQLQWIMNAYTIAVTSVLMAAGTLADRYGRKRAYLVSIAAFGLASLICGLADSAPLLIAARFFQGASGGAMLICQVAVLSHQFHAGPERARAFSAWGIVFGTGLGFGPLIGAGILALSGWSWVFLVHALLAVAAVPLAMAGVTESRDPEAKSLDLAGMATLSLSVFCLAYGITQGAGLPVFGLAAASFAAFILAEKRSRRPMFDFSVLAIRDFSGALIGSMGMNFSFWPFMIYLPIFFRAGLGYGALDAGLALLAYTLPTLIVPPLGERLLLRFRARIAIPTGLFVIGLGFLLMWIGCRGAGNGILLSGCLLSGIGLGLTNTPVTNTTTGSVSSARAGMASGIDMSARMISLAINIALMGFILVEGIKSALPIPSTELAEVIAGGAAVSTLPEEAVHAALAHGFAQVMLYGGLSVCGLAAVSRLVFGASRDAPPADHAEMKRC
jgi:MFS family permease